MKTITSKVVPINLKDIDTDLIIPAQFLKSTQQTGYGEHLFYNLRQKDPLFPTQLKVYQQCQMLVAKDNFGCGSSREHAVWALKEWGIQAIIATSFSDIFYSNALKNNLLVITLEENIIENFLLKAESPQGLTLTIDLPHQTIDDHMGRSYPFQIDPFRKECLLKDMNDLDYLLSKLELIRQFDKQTKHRFFHIQENRLKEAS